jgi:hypothetical protein
MPKRILSLYLFTFVHKKTHLDYFSLGSECRCKQRITVKGAKNYTRILPQNVNLYTHHDVKHSRKINDVALLDNLCFC